MMYLKTKLPYGMLCWISSMRTKESFSFKKINVSKSILIVLCSCTGLSLHCRREIDEEENFLRKDKLKREPAPMLALALHLGTTILGISHVGLSDNFQNI